MNQLLTQNAAKKKNVISTKNALTFRYKRGNFQINVPRRQDTTLDQTRPIPFLNTAPGLNRGGSNANKLLPCGNYTALQSQMEGSRMKYVTISKLSELIGYSEDAIRAKISQGKWRLGKHFKKSA